MTVHDYWISPLRISEPPSIKDGIITIMTTLELFDYDKSIQTVHETFSTAEPMDYQYLETNVEKLCDQFQNQIRKRLSSYIPEADTEKCIGNLHLGALKFWLCSLAIRHSITSKQNR